MPRGESTHALPRNLYFFVLGAGPRTLLTPRAFTQDVIDSSGVLCLSAAQLFRCKAPQSPTNHGVVRFCIVASCSIFWPRTRRRLVLSRETSCTFCSCSASRRQSTSALPRKCTAMSVRCLAIADSLRRHALLFNLSCFFSSCRHALPRGVMLLPRGVMPRGFMLCSDSQEQSAS